MSQNNTNTESESGTSTELDLDAELPTEYEKFVYDSAEELFQLRNQFEVMDAEKAHECFESVIDVISEYEKMTPCIASAEQQPLIESDKEIQRSELNSYHIGVKVVDSEIVDTEVVGIYYSPSNCFEERFDWVKPSLLDFDHQILVQTVDGVIYSWGFNDIQSLTPENLALHCASNMDYEYEFFQQNADKYDDVFNAAHKRILRPHIAEDYFYEE